MADIQLLLTATLADPEGELAQVRQYQKVADTFTVAGLVTKATAFGTAVAGMSDDTLREVSVSWRKMISLDLPEQGAYSNAEEKAYMQFRSLDTADRVTYQVPGPSEAGLKSDTETIDPTEDGVAAFITYTETNGTTATGAGNLKFDFGYRKRSSSRSERPGRSKAQG